MERRVSRAAIAAVFVIKLVIVLPLVDRNFERDMPEYNTGNGSLLHARPDLMFVRPTVLMGSKDIIKVNES
jgi:hypothetical protein